MQIIRTKIYARKVRKLFSEAEAAEAEDGIAAQPEKWPVIAGTNGVRKARAARGSAGKRGGVRILYYVWLQDDAMYLLDVYAKSSQEDISEADKKLLKQIIDELIGANDA